jgi:hypothetical protein
VIGVVDNVSMHFVWVGGCWALGAFCAESPHFFADQVIFSQASFFLWPHFFADRLIFSQIISFFRRSGHFFADPGHLLAVRFIFFATAHFVATSNYPKR